MFAFLLRHMCHPFRSEGKRSVIKRERHREIERKKKGTEEEKSVTDAVYIDQQKKKNAQGEESLDWNLFVQDITDDAELQCQSANPKSLQPLRRIEPDH